MRRAWLLMQYVCTSFAPSSALYKDMCAFLRFHSESRTWPVLGASEANRDIPLWCLDALKHTKMNGCRKSVLSRQEYFSIYFHRPCPLTVHFLGNVNRLEPDTEPVTSIVLGEANGRNAIFGDRPAVGDVYDGMCSLSCGEVATRVARRIGLQDASGWGLFHVAGEHDTWCRAMDYIGDILHQWETTASAVAPRLVFKKRLHRRSTEADPRLPANMLAVETFLQYTQAYHRVVQDAFPLEQHLALHLAALQMRIALGPYSALRPLSEDSYGPLEQCLPPSLINNENRPSCRSRHHWLELVVARYRDIGEHFCSVEAVQAEYLRVVRLAEYYRASIYLVQFAGFWALPAEVLVAIDETGLRLLHKTTKVCLKEMVWTDIKGLQATRQEFRLHLAPQALPQFERTLVFQTARAREIASLIASYGQIFETDETAPALGTGAVAAATPTLPLPTMSELDYLRELHRTRLQLVNRRVLREPMGGNTMRTSANKNTAVTSMRKLPTVRKLPGRQREEFMKQLEASLESPTRGVGDAALTMRDMEALFPPPFWGAQKSSLDQPLITYGLVEFNLGLDRLAMELFNSILMLSGLSPDGPGVASITACDSEAKRGTLIEKMILECINTPPMADELFLQLIKQSTEPQSTTAAQAVWQLLAIAMGCLRPCNSTVSHYLRVHLQGMAAQPGPWQRHAVYCLHLQAQSVGGRLHPPSMVEQKAAAQRQGPLVKVFLLNGQMQSYAVGPRTTVAELRLQITRRLGLQDVDMFGLFEVAGSEPLVLNELDTKTAVADHLWQWQAREAARAAPLPAGARAGSRGRRPTTEQLTRAAHGECVFVFKRSATVPYVRCPQDRVELDLALGQAMFEVAEGWYPLDTDSRLTFAALLCQLQLGDYNQFCMSTGYSTVAERFFDEQQEEFHSLLDNVMELHAELVGMTYQQAASALLLQCCQWAWFGASIIQVDQTYLWDWPQQLWMVLGDRGLALCHAGSLDPLKQASYVDVVTISPSPRNIMIVLESEAGRERFVLNTAQGHEIVRLWNHFRNQTVLRETERAQAQTELETAAGDLVPRALLAVKQRRQLRRGTSQYIPAPIRRNTNPLLELYATAEPLKVKTRNNSAAHVGPPALPQRTLLARKLEERRHSRRRRGFSHDWQSQSRRQSLNQTLEPRLYKKKKRK